MNPALWLCCFLPLLVLLLFRQGVEKQYTVNAVRKKRKGEKHMAAMVEEYIGKDCLVYTLNSQVSGVIREVRDGWLRIDNGKDCDVINLDFVIRVREYPKNKKGKRVSVVLD